MTGGQPCSEGNAEHGFGALHQESYISDLALRSVLRSLTASRVRFSSACARAVKSPARAFNSAPRRPTQGAHNSASAMAPTLLALLCNACAWLRNTAVLLWPAAADG